jgi:hypothetical protein
MLLVSFHGLFRVVRMLVVRRRVKLFGHGGIPFLDTRIRCQLLDDNTRSLLSLPNEERNRADAVYRLEIHDV